MEEEIQVGYLRKGFVKSRTVFLGDGVFEEIAMRLVAFLGKKTMLSRLSHLELSGKSPGSALGCGRDRWNPALRGLAAPATGEWPTALGKGFRWPRGESLLESPGSSTSIFSFACLDLGLVVVLRS